MLAIIDYGSGNIAALVNIFKQLRVPHMVTADPTDLPRADRYLLPGVGAFDPAMEALAGKGLLAALNRQVLEQSKPVLGICVGMQLLAQSSEEGRLAGLAWLPGNVRRMDAGAIAKPPRLPHMGWNSITARGEHRLFDGIDLRNGFYFLHSYYFDASDDNHVMATVTHGATVPCAVGRGNVFGVQFHPEKSHSNGVRLLQNFANMPPC